MQLLNNLVFMTRFIANCRLLRLVMKKYSSDLFLIQDTFWNFFRLIYLLLNSTVEWIKWINGVICFDRFLL